MGFSEINFDFNHNSDDLNGLFAKEQQNNNDAKQGIFYAQPMSLHIFVF